MSAHSFPAKFDCLCCSLELVQPSNVSIVEELFRFPDVRRYYILRKDHAANIRSFCQYIIDANAQCASLNYIIYDRSRRGVGFISADPRKEADNGPLLWNLGYAVFPAERRKGYAAAAVKGICDLLFQRFPSSVTMLDICVDNISSECVAKKCGFVKPDNVGYIDPEHDDLGLRFRWVKKLEGKRMPYFNKAVYFYRQKNYAAAIEAFRQALSEPYQEGTPYTDAQIYSNIGMALSSMRMYREAFEALKKAQSLGLTNASIERELTWLRINAGLS